MKLDLKKLVLIMGAVWTSAITLLLYFVPFVKVGNELYMGYNFGGYNALKDHFNETYMVVSHYITFALFAFILLFSIIFALVNTGKIKSIKLSLLPSGNISLGLILASFVAVINEIVSLFVFVDKNKNSLFEVRQSAGLWIILALEALFIFILVYVFFKFDEISPMVNSYEKQIIQKKLSKKKAKGPSQTQEPQQEQHLNRAQRRKQQNKK